MDGYTLEAMVTSVIPIGLVPEGLRLDAYYEGTVTDGPLSGDTVTGMDSLLLRHDGVGVIDARQAILTTGGAVSVHARGYLTPQLELPPLELVASPEFPWPDVEIPIHGSATMQSGEPALSAVNRTVYGFAGTLNVGRLELRLRAQSLAVVPVG